MDLANLLSVQLGQRIQNAMTQQGGGGGGVQLRGPNPCPILGKAGLRKHTLF